MDEVKTILICPLDWGLGHASRCIPLIRQFLGEGHNVIAACSGYTAEFIGAELPGIRIIEFPGYGITYPAKGQMALHMLLQLPKILYRIHIEHRAIKRIAAQYGIEMIVSDNRFGLYHKAIRCIYITHQVMIKCPPGLKFMEALLYRLHGRYIRKYNECWIPDAAGEQNISGDLSHKYPLPGNARYIGWLSRFNDFIPLTGQPESGRQYDVLAILSGPEPQRSIFEQILIRSLARTNHKTCIVRGTPGHHDATILPGNIDMIQHAASDEMYALMKSAGQIICRPGYSTLMDLHALQKNAVLVPTPGQTEQEYLAAYLNEKGLFYYCRQKEFDPDTAFSEAKKYMGFALT